MSESLACNVCRPLQQLGQHGRAPALQRCQPSHTLRVAQTACEHLHEAGVIVAVGGQHPWQRRHLRRRVTRHCTHHVTLGAEALKTVAAAATTCSHGQHHRDGVTRHNLLLGDGVANGQVVQGACATRYNALHGAGVQRTCCGAGLHALLTAPGSPRNTRRRRKTRKELPAHHVHQQPHSAAGLDALGKE